MKTSYQPPHDPRFGTWALALLLAIGAHAVGYAVPSLMQTEEEIPELTPSVLVEVTIQTPEPEPEPEPIVVEPIDEPELVAIAEPEPEQIIEPEPITEPEPIAEPEPVRTARAEPQPELDPAVDVDPELPPEPITIGLQGSSFAGNGNGPAYAMGDQVRGGRPDRRSRVRQNANAPALPETNEEPELEQAPAPTQQRTQRRGRRNRSRDARLARGVDRSISYPTDARRAGIETNCVVRMQIDTSGSVSDITMIRCDESDFGFEDAVRSHVMRSFQFDPAIERGVPIESQVRWVHEFRIDA